tara:strand:+ start:6672 stop:7067 length:396 start_codon:yes stop_codon:yes gene_type:complete
MNYQIENIIIIYGLVILFWIITVIWREYKKKDIMLFRKKILYIFNGWSVLHFINYTFLGYFAPFYLKEVIILGILFELLEIPMGMLISKYIDSKLILDTIVNTSGALLGYLLYKKNPKKIELKKKLINIIN